MEASVTGLLDRLRPLIKQRWEILLRAEPVVSPLATPDMLVFLMDATLDQLNAALHTRSVKNWLRHNQPMIAPLQSQCACGINPLLAYYSTGRTAVCAVAGEKLGPALAEVLLFYHGIAQKDIEALCGVCCHRGSADCAQAQPALAAVRCGAPSGS